RVLLVHASKEGAIERLPKIRLSRTKHVDVLDVVKVDSASAAIFQSDNRACSYSALQRHAVELSLGGTNVFINIPQAGWRQWDSCSTSAGNWSKWIQTHGERSASSGLQVYRRIVGRILNYVESHVSEIPLITDAISATQA